MTVLTAPLNASAIRPVCPSTWQLTKEQMESCVVSCYRQKSTAILRNIKGTKVFITFPSTWGKFFVLIEVIKVRYFNLRDINNVS